MFRDKSRLRDFRRRPTLDVEDARLVLVALRPGDEEEH